MFKKLSLIAILALSLSADNPPDDGDIGNIEKDIRIYNHGISLVKYLEHIGENAYVNYFVSWSTSNSEEKEDAEWRHDIYTNTFAFDGGDTIFHGENNTLIDEYEAQEPVSSAIIPGHENIIMSVWEDGRNGKNKLEVRGRLHYPDRNDTRDFGYNEDGIIDGYGYGGETHSPTVVHIQKDGDDEDLFLVAYVEGKLIKARLFDKDGIKKGDSKYLTSSEKISWWPVSATNDRHHAFIGWVQKDSDEEEDDNKTEMSGCVITVSSNYNISCKGREYETSLPHRYRYLDEYIKPYNYQVTWLDSLHKFFIIAKNRDDDSSTAATIGEDGSLKKRESIEGYPIVREAQLAVKKETPHTYKIVYPAGENDLGILKVTNGGIELKSNVNDEDNYNWHQDLKSSGVNNTFTVYKVSEDAKEYESTSATWPTTGISTTFVQDWDSGIWENSAGDENKLLFLFNNVNGDLVNVELKIDKGFQP